MTLEEATQIYNRCDRGVDDCGNCPLFREKAWEVGELGELKFSLCSLYEELLAGLKRVKA